MQWCRFYCLFSVHDSDGLDEFPVQALRVISIINIDGLLINLGDLQRVAACVNAVSNAMLLRSSLQVCEFVAVVQVNIFNKDEWFVAHLLQSFL